MNYSLNITECDAEKLQAPQQVGEEDKDYQDRLRAAAGKHFFRILVQDAESKQIRIESPYFDKSVEKQRWAVFDEGMKQVKKAIQASEKMNASAPKEEKSMLITEGTEAAFRRLPGRN